MAAQAATKKAIGLDEGVGEHAALSAQLERMHQEAVETEERCRQIAGGFDGKKTAILDEAARDEGKGRRDDEVVPR